MYRFPVFLSLNREAAASLPRRNKYGRTIPEIMRASATGNFITTLIYSRCAGHAGDPGDPPAKYARYSRFRAWMYARVSALVSRVNHAGASSGRLGDRACARARARVQLKVRCGAEPPSGATCASLLGSGRKEANERKVAQTNRNCGRSCLYHVSLSLSLPLPLPALRSAHSRFCPRVKTGACICACERLMATVRLHYGTFRGSPPINDARICLINI
jgi:hypothetical protein